MLGCPGSLADADKECFLQEERAHTILVASCAYGGCHSAKDKSTGLDLESPSTGKRLAGKASLTCNGGVLIEVGNADASVVYTKLSDPPPCGSRMPLAHPELADEDKQSIRAWITGLNGSCSGAGGAGGATSSGGAGGATSSGGMGGTTGGTGGTTSSGGMGGMGGTAGMGGM
jgi:hypothetical protein